jgi:hypothetical protein
VLKLPHAREEFMVQSKVVAGVVHPAAVFLVFIVLLAGVMPRASAQTAANVHFAFGETALVKIDGARIAVERGAEIEVGDTIVTGADGRVHLSFADGGYVSYTKFRIPYR